MKIKSKHVIDLTIADIIRMVKVDQDLDGEIEINIIDEINDGWVDVPLDWDHPYCPDPALRSDIFVSIKLRDGLIVSNIYSNNYGSRWSQTGRPCEIVQYRASKK